ncbi:Vps51 [Blattamonas nauphoetae]|uniref:Vps51 n=1 Tax=Blattamonas nauphoetae TaxID=2049346 RepID=A0ABQ9Y9S2_9EUKA|nr:Vps51 [Blattamonas nauphoetae]
MSRTKQIPDTLNLNKTTFDATNYAQDRFASQGDPQKLKQGIEKLKTELEETKQHLTETVHTNYEAFINTSNQIHDMETHLNEVERNLSQMKDLILSLHNEAQSFLVEPGENPKSIVPLAPTFQSNTEENFEDELNVYIQTRRFEEAVNLIETHRQNGTNKDLVENCMNKLADRLSHDQQHLVVIGELKKVINWLIQLNHKEEARELFFRHRSKMIKAEKIGLKFQGDIVLYVRDYSKSFFQSLNRAWIDYSNTFKERIMFPDFFAWMLSQIYIFCDTINTEVLSSDSLQFIGESMSIALDACETTDSSLHLTFLLKDRFIHYLNEAINSWNIEETFEQLIEEESKPRQVKDSKGKMVTTSWESRSILYSELIGRKKRELPQNPTLRLLRSGQAFFTHVYGYLSELNQIKTPEIRQELLNWVTQLPKFYFLKLTTTAESQNIYTNPQQTLSVIATMQNIVSYLINPLQMEIAPSSEDVQILSVELNKMITTMTKRFMFTQIVTLLHSTLEIDKQNYESDTFTDNPVSISNGFTKLTVAIAEINRSYRIHFPNSSTVPFMAELLLNTLYLLAKFNVEGQPDDFDKDSPLELPGLGVGGVHQLLLDVSFFGAAFQKFMNDSIETYMHKLKKRIVNLFEAIHPEFEGTDWLRKESFYSDEALFAFLNLISVHTSLDSILYPDK